VVWFLIESTSRESTVALTLSTLHRQLDFRVLSIGSDLDPDPETLRMKHFRTERVRATPKLFTYVLVGFIALLGLTCLYYGSSFAPGSRKSDEFDGSNNRVRTGIGSLRNRDIVLAVSRFEVPKSVPICDSRHSELIPCLDRNLHYQLKLKLNLSLMEHYEHHCPPSERRFNCLVPPPVGYKIPLRWPVSRDEVWKANIPHTHLAQEKSDQNWMVVNGDKINFPGGGTHFHNGADKYIVSLAQVRTIIIIWFLYPFLSIKGRARIFRTTVHLSLYFCYQCCFSQ
jgi:hypothetical protein